MNIKLYNLDEVYFEQKTSQYYPKENLRELSLSDFAGVFINSVAIQIIKDRKYGRVNQLIYKNKNPEYWL